MKPTGRPRKPRPQNIINVIHDPRSNELHVTFHNGHTYTYDNVTPESYMNLMKAPSLGQHFHAHIKSKHTYRKVR